MIKDTQTMSPVELADYRLELAGEYSWICSQLETVLARKPAVWNKLRNTVKSDTSADRLYQATEDGINETGLRLRLKSSEKMMSAIKTKIDIMTSEARNIM